MTRRYLITGGAGMLGRDLQRVFGDADVTATTHAQLDITDAGAVLDAVAGHDVVINAAAYTAVDAAEHDEHRARRINADGAANLATAAARHGATMVQISTDYVFSGTASSAYPESHPMDPRTAYGRTKAEGERRVRELLPDRSHVVRTAWLYGSHGRNFPRTILRLARERGRVEVIDDQLGQPTWSLDLATRIRALLDAESPAGTYHGTNSGSVTWHGLARRVVALAGLDPDIVVAVGSDAFPSAAQRPAFSVLGHDAWLSTGLGPMRPWQEALTEWLRTEDG